MDETDVSKASKNSVGKFNLIKQFPCHDKYLLHFCISVKRSPAEYKFVQLNDALQISTSSLFLNRYSISVRVIEISRRMLIAREAISIV